MVEQFLRHIPESIAVGEYLGREKANLTYCWLSKSGAEKLIALGINPQRLVDLLAVAADDHYLRRQHESSPSVIHRLVIHLS